MQFLRTLAAHVMPGAHNSYRPHLLRRQWLVVFLGITLTAEAILLGTLTLRQAGVPFLAAVVQHEIINYTNVARMQQGGLALTENPLLTAAAQRKAEDMAAKGYFAHNGPDGKEPWAWIREAGYSYRAAGENLAVRFVDSQDVIDGWMNSPTHRANIVKGVYTEIGVGVAAGTYKGAPATFVVQHFGAPLNAGAAVVQGSNIFSSFMQQLGSYFADPREAAAVVLALVALILTLVLGLTFVRHVQVQPAEVLLPGAAVALLAGTLLWVNSVALSPSAHPAAVGAMPIELGSGLQTGQ